MRNLTRREFGSLAAGISAATLVRPVVGQSAGEPIRIGYTMPLSGGLAGNGRPAFLAHKLWVEDVNAKGGLLGRKVELVNYDDQSNAGQVPALYTKLIEVDKVDLVISSYSTALIAPAMPVIMGHGMAFVTLLGSATNDAFQYDRTVNVSPTGGNMQQDFAKGFFEVAMSADPKPKTVAIAGLDGDFLQRSMKSARTQAQAAGLELVYDKSYPPSTVDYGPIVRAIQAAKPDIVYLASYPTDSVGLLKAIYETKLSATVVGGRHDRAADHRDQGAVWTLAQQPLVLGRLCSRADVEVSGGRGVPRAISRRGREGENGPARTLRPASRLCADASYGAGSRPRRQDRPGGHRRGFSREHVPDGAWRSEIRRQGRVAARTQSLCPVPRREGE
jgi:ABC-type branched-subunit amino acid transport system substrate-binding protein